MKAIKPALIGMETIGKESLTPGTVMHRLAKRKSKPNSGLGYDHIYSIFLE